MLTEKKQGTLKEERVGRELEKVMAVPRMVKCSLVATRALLPDHTPEIMMSLSQRLHVLADPIAALITELWVKAIQETADPGRIFSVR